MGFLVGSRTRWNHISKGSLPWAYFRLTTMYDRWGSPKFLEIDSCYSILIVGILRSLTWDDRELIRRQKQRSKSRKLLSERLRWRSILTNRRYNSGWIAMRWGGPGIHNRLYSCGSFWNWIACLWIQKNNEVLYKNNHMELLTKSAAPLETK